MNMTKKWLAIIGALVLLSFAGLMVFLLSPKVSSTSIEPEVQPEINKSTTSEGYLRSAIELINNESMQMKRSPDGIIEYLLPDNGSWVPRAHFEARDLVDVLVEAQVAFDEVNELYMYNYFVTSSPNSRQVLKCFGFQLEGAEGFEPSFPYDFVDPFTASEDEWRFVNSLDSNLWSWSCLSPYGLAPGFTESRFVFKSSHPPGIVICFAHGRINYDQSMQWVDSEEWLPPFPEWEDQGVKGRTIGPVPQELGRIELADRLLGYLPICVVEEWMNPYVETYLREQLQIYKTDVEQGIWSDARTRLEQSISYLEGLAEHELANQARILFTLNLRFLRYLT
jgi:hypothetical protein